MNTLFWKPAGSTDNIIDSTPEDAGGRQAGFPVHALKAGATARSSWSRARPIWRFPRCSRPGQMVELPKGVAIRRVFTDNGDLDETMAVSDGDAVFVPCGHNPRGAPYGYDYLGVLAGPKRQWRFGDHADHDQIYRGDTMS